MRRRLVAGLFPIAFAAASFGCGDEGSGDPAGSPELVVFAASSLGPALESYGPDFEGADVKYSFAGSDDLAAQIRQGVTPDVYAAASTELPDQLAADGLLQEPRAFVTNELVIGVPAGSDIDDVGDLARPEISVAIGDDAVPVGLYTREVLAELGTGPAQAILDNVGSSEPDVAGIVAKLTQGAVDAGFVYRTDVQASSGELDAVVLPKQVTPEVAYAVAVTIDAEEPALAQAFVDSLRSGAGQQVLRDSGFGPPPPGS